MSSPHDPQANAAFDPPGVTWTRVSPRLVSSWRLINSLLAGFVVLATAIPAVVFDNPWPWLGAIAAVVWGVWWWFLVPRQVGAWGYAEREDDLLVRHGLLARSLVVVPYGRMQYVDVQAGPLDRRFGIATVQLHTASGSTDASIPGLVPEEAARLRDRLASRGEARLAGL